jgi:hypothetical protein
MKILFLFTIVVATATATCCDHIGTNLVGAYVPQCAPDCSWRPRQCHGSTGFCWCVDTDGNRQSDPIFKSNEKCI